MAEVTQSEIGQKQKLQTVLEAVHDLLRPHGWTIKWNVDCEDSHGVFCLSVCVLPLRKSAQSTFPQYPPVQWKESGEVSLSVIREGLDLQVRLKGRAESRLCYLWSYIVGLTNSEKIGRRMKRLCWPKAFFTAFFQSCWFKIRPQYLFTFASSPLFPAAIHGKNLISILHLLVALAMHFRAPIRLPEHVSVQVVVVRVSTNPGRSRGDPAGLGCSHTLPPIPCHPENVCPSGLASPTPGNAFLACACLNETPRTAHL